MEHKSSTMVEHQQQTIVDTILQAKRYEDYYFNSGIEIKATPHTPLCIIHAIAISPKKEIWLFSSDCVWYKLEPTDVNYHLVISTLYQRVSLVFNLQAA